MNSNNPTIVLDAGDQFTGTVWNTFYQGQAAAELQNILGIDAMTLGNHDFDFGDDVLIPYLEMVDSPVLGACNIFTENATLAALIDKYTTFMLEYPDGKTFKVGIIGIITPSTLSISAPSKGTTFGEAIPSLQECITEMKSNEGDIDVVIVLSHVGFAMDKSIAKEVEGADMVIGGHSHTFLYSPKDALPVLLVNEDGSTVTDSAHGGYPVVVNSKVSPGKSVPVYQAYWGSRYMGNIEVTLSEDGQVIGWDGQPILLDSTINFDPIAQAAIDKLKVPLEGFGESVVGFTQVKLDNSKAVFAECNLGNAITDALIWYVKNQLPNLEGGAQIAIQNGGGIRISVPAGDILVKNVLEVLPFGNVATVKRMTGENIIKMIENGVSQMPNADGRFMQVSGLRYAFDPRLEAGSKVVGVALVIDGYDVEIDPCSYYNVAANSYVANGKDFYDMLPDSETLLETGPVIADVLSTYIKNNSPIAPKVEHRIINCQKAFNDPLCDSSFAVQRVCRWM
eukprot:TRINITY_DN296_c0_g1_i1.p1 TRINITY_DN296_c0_g1~~TRINITY_DN296_c0_g1_i1.p1  ORF type:complete len:590 (+),score=60.98 TRINITY_DN296_c0_g1_i1:246-1772(+)